MDLFDVAIKMEMEGARFYRELASKTSSEGIKRIFTMLAEDEERHKKTFEAMKRESNLPSMEVLAEVTQAVKIFRDLEKSEFLSVERHLVLYQYALEIEQKSIEFYQEELKTMTNEEQKEALEKIIGEEKEHYNLIDDIMIMVENPERWVEDAEFGIRNEY